MLQLPDIKSKSYTFKFNEVDCIFIPMALFIASEFLPLKPFMRKNKAILYWKVNGKQISYNQIKKLVNYEKT